VVLWLGFVITWFSSGSIYVMNGLLMLICVMSYVAFMD
jgi:hypothetical protein